MLTLDAFESEDLYEYLRRAGRDILIYGMGDGAAKVIHILRQKGLDFRDIFASDEFVRGQSFMGCQVKTLRQCEELYENYIILVAFASPLESVFDRICQIAVHHELYIPDVNVYGDFSAVFDREYLEAHFDSLRDLYDHLADEDSRRFLVSLIHYKLTGKLSYLRELDRERVNPYDYVGQVNTYCDLGAYNGDTVREWMNRHPEISSVIAFEPEPRHYKKLCDSLPPSLNALCVNAAASDCDGSLRFCAGRGKGSSGSGEQILDGFRAQKEKEIPARSLDSVVFSSKLPSVDLIKYDVEGQEPQALLGSEETIRRFSPALIVSVYHCHDHLTGLYEFIRTRIGPASYYLSRKVKCFPAWEVELTIIPQIRQNN